jgi:hypothetical protein
VNDCHCETLAKVGLDRIRHPRPQQDPTMLPTDSSIARATNFFAAQ